MAWRPHAYLEEGELDNTVPGKVTGWLRFAGMKKKVTLDLVGDFHRDIRGAKVRLKGEGTADENEADRYMDGFAVEQTGEVGDMTAGLPPADYTRYPYFEWYGTDNGRIVLELEPSQVEVIGRPIPACELDPVSRQAQDAKMACFLTGIAQDLGLSRERVVCIGPLPTETTQDSHPSGTRTKILTREIRSKLPPLGGQDGKGGKAIAWAKFFTPSSCFTWYATEGQEEGDDFLFFGLVEGFEKELGYFSLKELESVRGPFGLGVERDIHWQPKPLEEIAPELFTPLKPAE